MKVKLKPEIKQMWLEALRFGDYKQGRKTLRNESNEFCCLGVLCDISTNDGIGKWIPSSDSKSVIQFIANKKSSLECRTATPPDEVSTWAFDCNLYREEQNDQVDNIYWALVRLNDSGKSFEEIADYIEENL